MFCVWPNKYVFFYWCLCGCVTNACLHHIGAILVSLKVMGFILVRATYKLRNTLVHFALLFRSSNSSLGHSDYISIAFRLSVWPFWGFAVVSQFYTTHSAILTRPRLQRWMIHIMDILKDGVGWYMQDFVGIQKAV